MYYIGKVFLWLIFIHVLDHYDNTYLHLTLNSTKSFSFEFIS